MDSVNKFLEIFSNILEIIGFEEQEKERYISRFFVLVETKTIKRLYPRMDEISQNELTTILESLNKEDFNDPNNDRIQEYSNKITEIIERSINKKELFLIYNEVIEDLFTSFLTDVMPSTTEEQKKQIEVMMNSLSEVK